MAIVNNNKNSGRNSERNSSINSRINSKSAPKRKTAKQLPFFKPQPRQFGGSLLKGNPKEQRPLSTKKPLHLVLKSNWAFGDKSMLSRQNVKNVDSIIRKQAKACEIRLYHLVNVGNHLHIVVKIEDRKLYRNFIRSVSGLIARQFLQKQRGPEKTEAIEAAVVAKKFTKLLACKAHHSDRFVGP